MRDSSIILKALKRTLGVVNKDKISTSFKNVDVVSASEFLNENHLHGETTKATYIGGYDSQGHLQSIIAMQADPEQEHARNITRFASNGAPEKDLAGLINEAKKQGIQTLTVSAENGNGEDIHYLANDFEPQKTTKPAYMFLIKGKRHSVDDYPMERFRTDPTLKWEAGLSVKRLGDLNGWDRIWDAGTTHFRLEL